MRRDGKGNTMLCYEDFRVGDVISTRGRTVTGGERTLATIKMFMAGE
jgi:hypothetical protein